MPRPGAEGHTKNKLAWTTLGSILDAYRVGRRVVEGPRLMQTASDILLGRGEAEGPDTRSRRFYVRRLWDGKGSVDVERMSPSGSGLFGALCARTFDRAIAEFAERYADQSERDYAALLVAEERDEIEVERGRWR